MIETIDKNQLNGTYRGYLWYSDRVFPELIWDERVDANMLSEFPFVVEGQLFDEKAKESVRITHIDGQYRIARMRVPDDYADRTQAYYASGKFAEFAQQRGDAYNLQLLFYTEYADRPDPLQPGFTVARPAWTAFAGFSETLKQRTHE